MGDTVAIGADDRAPGLRADLVLLDGDPLTDVRNVTHIHRVIQDGRIVDREALLRPPG